MDASSTPSTTDTLLGLMIISGFMLLISAVPIGIALSLQVHYEHDWEWRWAITLGGVMTLATAVVGGLLDGIGEHVVRRWTAQERVTHNDDSYENTRANARGS